MTEFALRAESISKRYVKYEDTPMLIGALVRFRARSRRSRLWALRDVSFDIEAGSSVGIIGRNGSGKTTLLRMLAGITAPTTGAVTANGRVAPLISVGVGFHQELTGRENVYVNGIMLGLSKHEIDRCFDEIVDFAELESFIDTPVKFYSSGMFVRLGFATAVAVNPDILLIDEVLAVGDFAFREKCYQRIAAIRESGTTIVLVSHSIEAIRGHCPRSILLHEGELRFDGETDAAIALYHRLLGESRDADAAMVGDDPVVDVACSVDRITVVDDTGEPATVVRAGQDVAFEFDVRWEQAVVDPMFGVMVLTEEGSLVYADHTHGQRTGTYAAGERATFRFRTTARLGTGMYKFRVMVRDHEGRSQLMAVAKEVEFYVSGRSSVRGFVDLQGELVAPRSEEARAGEVGP